MPKAVGIDLGTRISFVAGREIETRIGRALIAGHIPDGSTITLDGHDGALDLRWAERAGSPEPAGVGA